MSHDAWVFLGLVVTGLCTLLTAVLVEQIRQRRRVEQVGQQVGAAAEAAKDAAELARPTGNGYAGRTEAGIAAAVAASNANTEKLDQILEVATQLEKRMGATEQQVTSIDKRMGSMETGLSRHLNDHAAAHLRAG